MIMKALLLALLLPLTISAQQLNILSKGPSGILLGPASGDSYPELQWALDYSAAHGIVPIRLIQGEYDLSRGLIGAKIVGGVYQQVSFDIQGLTSGRNTGYCATLVPRFVGAVLILQQCKSCLVANLGIQGSYPVPRTMLGVDTATLIVSSPTAPNAAIVIDAFDDPVNHDPLIKTEYAGDSAYYIPGMSRSGSTDVRIQECGISGFEVGIMVTPSNQQNGELIAVNNCRIDYCQTAYAYTQAQAKTNTVYNLMCWGGVHTIFDGTNYGVGHSDGAISPMIDVVNIAGAVYQFIEAYAGSFPISIWHVYAEGLLKIGRIGGPAGVHFMDCQFDLQLNADGAPFPDFTLLGDNNIFTGCMLRVYGAAVRLILSGHNSFSGGSMSAPPIVTDIQQVYNVNMLPVNKPVFDQVTMVYTGPFQYNAGPWLQSNSYDSIIPISPFGLVHIDRATFTGWCIVSGALKPGDMLLTVRAYDNYSITTYQYPLGLITAYSGDTAYLTKMGIGIRDGSYYVWADR